ncbi:TPA: family 43 glycosylhydrolase [Streptococcus suis]|nr:family 43 glycosylhydrolase [Streptococcus suis]
MHGLGENKLLAMKGRKRQVYLLSLLFISLFIGFLLLKPRETILYSFMPDGDWRKHHGFVFYEAEVSHPLQLSKIASYSSSEMPGRDMSLWQEKNGTIWAAVTYQNSSTSGEVRLYSGDSVNELQAIDINLGITKLAKSLGREVKSVWAPEFFQDTDGSIYLLTTVNDQGTMVDRNKDTIAKHSIYLSKMNMEGPSVLSTELVDLSSNKNYIDPHIYKKDGIYHLFLKDEYSKTLDYFQSSNLKDWNLITEDFIQSKIGQDMVYTEGQFLLEIDDKYYFFFDKYDEYGLYPKGQYVIVSNDFVTFSLPQPVSTMDKEILRHGSGIVYHQKSLFENFFQYFP